MFNKQLREKLDNPKYYELMIALIMTYNPACTSEDWAARVINTCIQGVLDGDQWCGTGMCLATQTEEGVLLSFQPLSGILSDTALAQLVEQLREHHDIEA